MPLISLFQLGSFAQRTAAPEVDRHSCQTLQSQTSRMYAFRLQDGPGICRLVDDPLQGTPCTPY